jgi:hypothetical protein
MMGSGTVIALAAVFKEIGPWLAPSDPHFVQEFQFTQFDLGAFRNAGISKSEFGRKIGKDEKEVRRLLDPKHATKLSTLTEALRVLGRRLIIGVEAAA